MVTYIVAISASPNSEQFIRAFLRKASARKAGFSTESAGLCQYSQSNTNYLVRHRRLRRMNSENFHFRSADNALQSSRTSRGTLES